MTLGNIVRLWGAVNFEPDFTAIQRLYDAAKPLKKDFQHWQTKGSTFTFYENEGKHEFINVTVKRIGFEVVNPGDISKDLERMAKACKILAEGLGCKVFNRMGVKLLVYADLDLTFEDLKRQVQTICLPKNELLEKLTSPDVIDVALNFDYQRDGKKVALRVGPMGREQGVGILKTVGSIEQVFQPLDQSRQFIDVVESIPESFLYFDVDAYIEEDNSLGSWVTFATETIQYELELFDGLKKLVLECD